MEAYIYKNRVYVKMSLPSPHYQEKDYISNTWIKSNEEKFNEAKQEGKPYGPYHNKTIQEINANLSEEEQIKMSSSLTTLKEVKSYVAQV